MRMVGRRGPVCPPPPFACIGAPAVDARELMLDGQTSRATDDVDRSQDASRRARLRTLIDARIVTSDAR
jgi:hypothetical protein